MQYAEKHGVPYSTVIVWLRAGLFTGAVLTVVAGRRYWEVPENAPRPAPKRGAPSKK